MQNIYDVMQLTYYLNLYIHKILQELKYEWGEGVTLTRKENKL